MPTLAKEQTVAELAERMNRMQMLLITDCRGLTVAEMTQLRSAVRAKGGEIVVAKNTLTRLAARESGNTQIEEFLKGPSTLTFSYDDVPGVAKAIDDYFKATKKDVKVKGGLVGSSVITPGDLERVSKMASRQDSLAKVLGGVNAPASRIVGAINSVMRNIAYVLKAHSEQASTTEA
ncbi:MAG: 50S ribosomal protein L10 [Herpetosiphonaceae bacterium]|nr:50S ribosomal protein L10 [Herpetosiphonaceae bacterium]